MNAIAAIHCMDGNRTAEKPENYYCADPVQVAGVEDAGI